MIKVKSLNKKYGSHQVLVDVNLNLPEKGFITLFGASGSGKTTLLNIIGGIEREYDGNVDIKNTNLECLSEEDIRSFRINNIGYIFQNFNLINQETVFENVKVVLDAIAILDEKTKVRRVNDILRKLKIIELAKKPVNKLSGGEKQRVAIARAIINNPILILADEPTGALDEVNSENIYKILKKISYSSLVIVASHDEQIKKYADQIYEISDGAINSLTINESNKDKGLELIGGSFKRKKTSLPLDFKIKHSLRKIKLKKYRSLITNGVLSLALSGIGISLIISSSISSRVNEALSDLLNGNQIVMNLKQENYNPINNVYSAPKEKVYEIKDNYEEYITGVGTTYLVNFEDFFKSKNSFYISSTEYKIDVPSLSARTINDYKVIDDDYQNMTYPYLPSKLNDDQLVLGLSYVDMVNICFSLKIQRSYASLGEYIRLNKLFITLEVSNELWQYEDEQLFQVSAVCETSKSMFFHYLETWNEIVFEEKMMLPSDDDTTHEYPWEMHKIYFLRTLLDPAYFINEISYNDAYYDYVFERTSSDYHPLLCKIGEVCAEKRVIVYYADKNSIDLGIVRRISELEPKLSNYYLTSDYGYSSFASAMMNGFSKNVYASLNENDVYSAIEADEKIDDISLKIDLPKGTINGNYLNGLSGGLRFSSFAKSILKGRMPKNLDEIAISKGLEEEFNNVGYGKEMYLSSITYEYLDENGKLNKEYQVTKLNIVGIIDEEKPYLYHSNDWSISFFRDKLGVSSFQLVPVGVVFELDDDVDTKGICDRFGNIFSDYNFKSPSIEITSSINSTLEYANIILIAFSILAIVISLLLLATIVMINIIESKGEIEMFRYIGISSKESESIFIFQSLIQGIIAFLISSFELIFIDFFITKILGDNLHTSLNYKFNYLPIVVIFFVSILMSYFVSLFITKIIKK